jgi:hypothetical protein
MAHLTLPYLSDYKKIIGSEEEQKYTHDIVNSNTGSLFLYPMPEQYVLHFLPAQTKRYSTL